MVTYHTSGDRIDHPVDRSVIIVRLRHATAPPPGACRWCGVGAREHGYRWVPSKQWHDWHPPTVAQQRARMLTTLKTPSTR